MFGPLHGQFESKFGFPLRLKQFVSQFGFPLRPRQLVSQFGFPLRPRQLEPQFGALGRGKVGGRGEAEGFTPESIPLGPKSGIFSRAKKGNTYATSTHFHFFFFQNWSNCKTVLYLRDPPTGHHSPSSSGYRGHAASHRKTRCVFFKPWGSNLSQFFRI